jgi:hypothetical protein
MTEDLRVTCDQCGSWQIRHRRKVALPIRHLKLSAWISEIPAPKTEPGALQSVEMVAECQECHFTVEYTRMES